MTSRPGKIRWKKADRKSAFHGREFSRRVHVVSHGKLPSDIAIIIERCIMTVVNAADPLNRFPQMDKDCFQSSTLKWEARTLCLLRETTRKEKPRVYIKINARETSVSTLIVEKMIQIAYYDIRKISCNGILTIYLSFLYFSRRKNAEFFPRTYYILYTGYWKKG